MKGKNVPKCNVWISNTCRLGILYWPWNCGEQVFRFSEMTNSFHFFKSDIQADVSKIHPNIGHLISAEKSLSELFDRAGWLSWSNSPLHRMELTKKLSQLSISEKISNPDRY